MDTDVHLVPEINMDEDGKDDKIEKNKNITVFNEFELKLRSVREQNNYCSFDNFTKNNFINNIDNSNNSYNMCNNYYFFNNNLLLKKINHSFISNIFLTSSILDYNHFSPFIDNLKFKFNEKESHLEEQKSKKSSGDCKNNTCKVSQLSCFTGNNDNNDYLLPSDLQKKLREIASKGCEVDNTFTQIKNAKNNEDCAFKTSYSDGTNYFQSFNLPFPVCVSNTITNLNTDCSTSHSPNKSFNRKSLSLFGVKRYLNPINKCASGSSDDIKMRNNSKDNSNCIDGTGSTGEKSRMSSKPSKNYLKLRLDRTLFNKNNSSNIVEKDATTSDENAFVYDSDKKTNDNKSGENEPKDQK